MAGWHGDVRKTVTVLFCDLTGSTDLGERLDPEALRRVTFRFFDEMRDVLERHGGTVEKYAGDDIMAVFGVPSLHEDDALRAVTAAEAMHERLERLNDELERGWGVRLEVRIGINTGEVVTSDVVAGEKTLATGDAVNLAKRIQQAAEPGEILLGRQTYRLIRDHVEAGPLEAFSVKERVVSPWRLLDKGERQVPARSESPFVGRETELHLLESHYRQAVADRRCRLVTVLGPAGVGKSRLAREVSRRLLDASVAKGRCLPYGEGITFWPIREIVRQTARIGPDDSGASAREKIGALLPAEDADSLGRTLTAAIGLDVESPRTEEIFWALRRYLEALARRRALVLVVEDIHWAEPTFLDLLHYLEGWCRDAPIFLLSLARPDLVEQRPSWVSATETISLDPLSRSEADRLLVALMDKRATAASDRIWEVSEGNPLFVEEIVQMLAETGGSELAMPPTINALLATRLDRLEPDERAVIQIAAVIGRQFGWTSVRELAPDELTPRVRPCLQALVRKKMISPDETTAFGEDAFRFAHILMRDAAYAALPKGRRAELHRRHAESLERRGGERLGEYQEIVGYHLEQAYRSVAELGPLAPEDVELGREAGAVLSSAGRRALTRGDAAAATSLLQRARFLLEATEESVIPTLVDLGVALRESGRLDAAVDVLDEALELGREDSARPGELRVRVELAYTRVYTGEESIEELRRIAGEAAAAGKDGDDAALARALMLAGQVEYSQCQMAAAEATFERALEHASRAGERQQERFILIWLSRTNLAGPREAADALERAAELQGRLSGDRLTDAACAVTSAVLEAMLGRFREARRGLHDGLALLHDLARPVSIAAAGIDGATIESLAGDATAAVESVRASVETLQELGDNVVLPSAAAVLAEMLVAVDEDAEADVHARFAEERAAPDDAHAQISWRLVRARLDARAGAVASGVALAREAVGRAGETDSRAFQAEAQATLAEVLRLAQAPDEAEAALAEAVALWQSKGNVVAAERLAAQLEEMRLSRSTTAASGRGSAAGGT